MHCLPPLSLTWCVGKKLYLVDGLSVQQCPNYALAKRLQHWRAIVAREEGHRVSSNIAPSTATESVTSNVTFQWAYGGFHIFKPLEVMYQCVGCVCVCVCASRVPGAAGVAKAGPACVFLTPPPSPLNPSPLRRETSNAVMMALLVADLRDEDSHANPKKALTNPYELFKHNSFHGGVWRCGYRLDTIGEVAVLYYLLSNYWLPVSGALGALAGVVAWVITGRVGPL